MKNGLKKTKNLLAAAIVAGFAATLSGCFVPIPVPIPIPFESQVDLPPIGDTKPSPDSASDLAEFLDQTIDWEKCGSGFECADIKAPMDWDDPSGEAISLHLVKQAATGSKKLGSLFVNPGGPGASGADFVKDSIDYAVGKPLQKNFDVIGWDPRGVGKSSAVACYDQEEMDEYLFGYSPEYAKLERGSDEWFEVVREESREYADACYEKTGELLAHVDTVSTVKDLDLMRHLVGDDKLNYLGFSYGTFIGSLYAEHFPENVGHLVLDGAIAPDVTTFDVVLMQQQGFEAATRAYLADCIGSKSCPFTGTVEEAMKEIDALITKVDKKPLKALDGRWVDSGTFITAIILPLYNESNWPLLDTLFAEMRQGDPETAQWLADYYYGRDKGYYEDNSTEAFSAINCLDYPPAGDDDQLRREAKLIAEAAPVFGKYSGFGGISCQEWKFPGVSERGPVSAAGADPILVIGTTGDPATPYAWSKQLADQLESGVMITNNGEGHGAYTSGNKCIDKTVEEYFISGTVPESDPNC